MTHDSHSRKFIVSYVDFILITCAYRNVIFPNKRDPLLQRKAFDFFLLSGYISAVSSARKGIPIIFSYI